MQAVYGLTPKDKDDEILALNYEGAEIFIEAFIPGKYLVESLPILRYIPTWFPGAGFKRQAAVWREAATRQLHVPYADFVKRQVGCYCPL